MGVVVWHKRYDEENPVKCTECCAEFKMTLAVSARRKKGDERAGRFCTKACSRTHTIKTGKLTIDPETGLDKLTASNLKSACTKRATIDEASGMTVMERQVIRQVEALSKVGEDGLNGWQRGMQSTLSRHGELFPGREITMLERYGEVIPTRVPEIVARNRQARIEAGYIHSDELKTELRKYYCAVWRCTDYLLIKNLENHDKRGKSGTPGAYQLDHRVSLSYGFKNGINPAIIGHIRNLVYIPWEDNIEKRAACSVSLSELLMEILDYETCYHESFVDGRCQLGHLHIPQPKRGNHEDTAAGRMDAVQV